MKLLDKDGLTYYTSKIKNELIDYVKNTDYATSSKGGVFKYSPDTNTSVYNGVLIATTNTYEQYQQKYNDAFIGKGTLENVIAGKDLTTKTYVDGLVGDIGTILDSINNEVL